MELWFRRTEVNIIVNLFEIDNKYLSHPNYPYLNHIKNIADSFDDDKHKIAAKFHDFGKLCNAFQTYINPKHPNKKKTTHALIGALFFLAKHNYKLDKNSLPIFLSILKHHGNLEDVNTLAYDFSDCEDLLYDNPKIIDKLNEIESIIGSELNVNLEKCCDCFDSDDEEFVIENDLGTIDSYFQIKEVFSKLIFADKYEAIFKQRYKESKFKNVKNYITDLEKHLSRKVNDLSAVRNSARKEILEKFNQNINKSIFIIEAPTGIGKTFTALHLALEIVKQKSKKRIITALPMTSIIDQTFVEYSNIFEQDVLLKYHHLTKSKSYEINKEEEKKEEEEYFKQKDSYLTKSWAEDYVIITTFNQILNLFYSNRNRDLIKFWTLRNSVIIMDEIQAIPRVLLRDFAKTISFLSKHFNIDFVLMSATIPEIKNFLDTNITTELLDNKYYSLEFNNRYALHFNHTIDSEENLLDEIERKYSYGNSVLAVVNTKSLALRLFEKLSSGKNKNNIFLLSSYFIPKHRKEIIENISDQLKNGNKPILISTQVIEAGVDLDFDCGFREFSPFYSIIQTAGRINRENRDEVKESASLTIFPEIGYSPYHQNDLLKEDVEKLLIKDVRENKLLPLLKDYFKTAIVRTQPDLLLVNKMKNLEFQEVIKIFNNNFMKKIPYTTQLFIEIEKGLYESFFDQLEFHYNSLKTKLLSLEQKMEIKILIKDVYKEIAQFVINVSKNDVNDFETFYKESEMKVCYYDDFKAFYSYQTGWKRTNDNYESYIL